MKLKDKVVSLELAKTLDPKEWEDCEYVWCKHLCGNDFIWSIFPHSEINTVNEFRPALLPCEIWDRLPMSINCKLHERDNIYSLKMDKIKSGNRDLFHCVTLFETFVEEKPSDSLTKMYNWCKEKGYLK